MILIVVDSRCVIHDIRGGTPFGPVLARAHFFEGIDMRKAQSRVCRGASILLLSSPALSAHATAGCPILCVQCSSAGSDGPRSDQRMTPHCTTRCRSQDRQHSVG